jgi:periplasmic divalent cation tolerance protein
MDAFLVYIPFETLSQAKKLGRHLLKKRLSFCINILPEIDSLYFWPPKTGKIEESKEVVLIAKTTKDKLKELEKEVLKLASYEIPCIIGIKLDYIQKKYYNLLKEELK